MNINCSKTVNTVVANHVVKKLIIKIDDDGRYTFT